MFKRLIIVSGPIASGKSMLARHLVEKHGATCFRTKDWILARRPRTAENRLSLQAAGEALDRATKGRWVVDSLVSELRSGSEVMSEVVVIDSVRIPQQVEALRQAYASPVVHIHITASEDELRNRHNKTSRRSASE